MDLMLFNSDDLSLKHIFRKLNSRVEAVENFIIRQFGDDALGSINQDNTSDGFNDTKLLTESDNKRKRRHTQSSKSHRHVRKNKRKSSPQCPAKKTWKRTRSMKRISYKEEDDSNSETQSKNNDNDNDYNTLLVPKNEMEDPSYDQPDLDAEEINYFDEDYTSGKQNSEDDSPGDDDGTNSSGNNDRKRSIINSQRRIRSGVEENELADDSEMPIDKDAPWMQEDYVPPTLLPTPGSRRPNCFVLAFRDHTYRLDSNCKTVLGTKKEKNKKTWRCSVGVRTKCKARMYTWGPEYKVLGFWEEHSHPPRMGKIETRLFMDKLKKVAMTTDLSIPEIIENGLKDATEKTKSLLPDMKSLRHILYCVRKPLTGQKSNAPTTPSFNHLINKLKQGELSSPKNKNDLQNSDCSSKITNSSFENSTAANKKPSILKQSKSDPIDHPKCQLSQTTSDENDNPFLLLPKTELVCFDDYQDEEDCESPDMNPVDAEEESDDANEDDCTPNENDLNAPFLQEGYEPPFILEKGSTKRLLVYGEFTYTLCAKHRNTLDECSGLVIRERRESEKQIWRCTLSNANRNHPINCWARMYTWGPEHKVLGFRGEHSHPRRTNEIKKLIFLDKLREIARTTDTPINEIVDDALKNATDDLKSALPKIESIKSYLRATRKEETKPHVVNRQKIAQLAKKTSESETTDNKNNSLVQHTTGMIWGQTSIECGQFTELSHGNTFNFNLPEEPALQDDDSVALWMKDDYVPPTVLPSKASVSGGVSRVVLAFKGHLYRVDGKCRRSLEDQKDVGKLNWKCNFAGGGNKNSDGETCYARIYTWGPEYKVLGTWSEHNHPPISEKIEARIFLEDLKRIVATTQTSIPQIVNDALSDTSEEFKESLPKLESIYSILRKIRNASFGNKHKDRCADGSPRKPSRKGSKNKCRTVN